VPTIPGWPEKAAAHQYTESDFDREGTALGVLLGGARNLTDVDCDTQLAVALAAQGLPMRESTCKFGHKSKTPSHYLYYTDESLPSAKLKDPLTQECIIEYRSVKKDGSRGYQTVIPPSIHPSGEPIEYLPGHEPSQIVTISAQKLLRRVLSIGAIALMAKYWPENDRHYTKRAWARVLSKGGLKPNDIEAIITSAYEHSRKPGHNHSKDLKDIREVWSPSSRTRPKICMVSQNCWNPTTAKS